MPNEKPSEIFFGTASVDKSERKSDTRDFHRPELAPIQFLPIEIYTRTKQRRPAVTSETKCSFSSTENSQQSKRETTLSKPDTSVSPNIGRELYEEFFLGAHKKKDVRKFLKANEFR